MCHRLLRREKNKEFSLLLMFVTMNSNQKTQYNVNKQSVMKEHC